MLLNLEKLRKTQTISLRTISKYVPCFHKIEMDATCKNNGPLIKFFARQQNFGASHNSKPLQKGQKHCEKRLKAFTPVCTMF